MKSHYSRRYDVSLDRLPLFQRSTFGWHVRIPRWTGWPDGCKNKSLALVLGKISIRVTIRRYP